MLEGLLVLLGQVLLKWLSFLTSYVNSSNTFPQPLSEEEEARHLRLLEKGDPHARNVLIERNLRLVAHIVKKFDNCVEDPEDLISIGTVGLIKAISTFNQGKGTRLATYAARCIENEILMYLRSTRKIRAEVSLYDPIGIDREGNEITLIDVLGSDPEYIPEMVDREFEEARLIEKLRVLDKKERKVLQLRYGLFGSQRRTQREIAYLLGISRSYVSRIEKKAVHKLSRELCADQRHA
ncbi:MAG: RNA polymerase sporulation sigma factor SigK [Ignavibacteriales bacterium]